MKQLLPYQLEGIEYALKRKGTLIADEMGLGKTAQAIGYINANPGIRTALVVCPASLKLNWWNEIETWLERKERVAISVTNYEALSKVPNTPIDLLILDEAHYVKNPKSQRCEHVKRIAKRCKFKLALTGTPIENRPIELWPILQVICPERWDKAGFVYKKNDKGIKVKTKVGEGEGAGFFRFAKRYCDGKKEFGRYDPKLKKRSTHWNFQGASNLEELNEWLRETCMVRRLKKDVLTQLPPKTHQLITLPSRCDDSDLFPELEHDFEKAIAELQSRKVEFTEYSKRRHEQGLEKLDLAAEHLLNCVEDGGKVIVFAQHNDVILGLVDRLEQSTHLVKMTSDMNVTERQSVVDHFQTDPSCKMIIGSIRTMGTGHTLTAASRVVFVEIEPIPGLIAQCVDRAHRMGQTDPVLAQYLVLNGSLDARICKLLIEKQKIVSSALDPVIRHIETVVSDSPVITVDRAAYSAETCKHGRIGPCVECCNHPHGSIKPIGKAWKCDDCGMVMR